MIFSEVSQIGKIMKLKIEIEYNKGGELLKKNALVGIASSTPNLHLSFIA